jgi:hypothetical protein
VNVGPNEVVQLVTDTTGVKPNKKTAVITRKRRIYHHKGVNAQHSVDDFDQQVPFLILKRWGHEQREYLIEERSGAEGTRVVCYLAKRHLAHRRRAVLYLQHQLHDAALIDFVLGQALKGKGSHKPFSTGKT